MALPSGFTQLEYIQSSGTQYIDTGFKPNQDTKVIFQFNLESTDVCYIYGCRGGEDDGYNNRYGILHNDSGFRSDYGTGNGPYFSSSLSVNTKYYSNKDRNVCSIGDSSVTNSTATFQSPRNMFLFGVNEAGSFMYGCTLKVYSCQIYDNDTLVRDFVPCTNSAGTAGLYDTVNGVFYQSAGSGAFTAGPVKKGTHKTMVDGTAYEIKGGKVMVDGTSYSIKKGRTLVDGTGYEIGFGQAISDLPVGASVFMNVNGAEKEFLIVHQGKPSTLYDDSCDGTWLLIKDLYESRAWHSSDANEYANSTIHSYLNSTFLALFDSNIQTAIKEVKIPYIKLNTNGTYGVASGANGLPAKIFLLSLYEVGFDKSVSQYFLEEGAKLDYFEAGDTSGGTNRTKRIAYLNGTASAWWTRSADTLTTGQAFYVRSTGSYGYYNCSYAYRIRPALILPGDTLVDDNFKVIT